MPCKSTETEYGLVYYMETVVNGKAMACMFDYGPNPAGVMNNIALPGLDLGKANGFSLNHGNIDHHRGRGAISPG